MTAKDQETADKFATSWNNVADPSVYTRDQFIDWIAPLDQKALEGQKVLELGCGSGALLDHMKDMKPGELLAVDLGSSVETARALLKDEARIEVGDITQLEDLKERFGQQDVCYCIGVLHHLKVPEEGVKTLLGMARPGGRFHGWVYAKEGNLVVRLFVEPLRRIVNHFPWYVNKYLVALPLALPFFLYSKFCCFLQKLGGSNLPLPMFRYMTWIGKRDLFFHHHVAFDQLVTPMTHFIDRARVEAWVSDERVEPGSAYIEFRNGNGWKFGGRIRSN